MTFIIRSDRLTWDDCLTVSSVLTRAFDGSLDYQPALIRNMVAAGNFICLAEHGGDAVGALVGHLATGPSGPFLYSGPMAVLAEHRRTGAAAAMKEHQRRWALERGLHEIVWPFHPRNVSSAHVSLALPGARCERFDSGYYGPAPAGSRLIASWKLDEGQVAPAPSSDWIDIDGQDDDALVAALQREFEQGRSVVRIVDGRYGLN